MRGFLALLASFSIYAQPALAGTNGSKANETVGLISLGVCLAAFAYAGNKWRMWWFGFQIGEASGAEFVSALKWSLIGLVVVAASIAAISLSAS